MLDHAVRFLRSLPVKLRAKAFRGIDLLRELGPELPMPHSKTLKGTDGLREFQRTPPPSRPLLVVDHGNGPDEPDVNELALIQAHAKTLLKGVIDEEG